MMREVDSRRRGERTEGAIHRKKQFTERTRMFKEMKFGRVDCGRKPISVVLREESGSVCVYPCRLGRGEDLRRGEGKAERRRHQSLRPLLTHPKLAAFALAISKRERNT